ncbi:MAG: sigma-70 family RNA polymerase sigma factor [Pseudomonadota bacterium]
MITERVLGRLTARLRRVYGDGPPEPEDLAQAAVEKLAGRATGDIENVDAYLFRTAVNMGLNQIERARVARRYAEFVLTGAHAPVVEETTPEDVYSGRERLERLKRALNTLTPKQRTIVARSRLRGETYAEIRAATGWSEADISRQLKAALARLQDELDPDPEGNGR